MMPMQPTMQAMRDGFHPHAVLLLTLLSALFFLGLILHAALTPRG